MKKRMERVRKYVREVLEDGLHAVASFAIAWFILGYALLNKYDLRWVLNFNLRVLEWACSFVPWGYGPSVETALRLFGADHIIFFGELWAFAAIVIRVIGLCFRGCRWLVKKPFKSRNRSRDRI